MFSLKSVEIFWCKRGLELNEHGGLLRSQARSPATRTSPSGIKHAATEKGVLLPQDSLFLG